MSAIPPAGASATTMTPYTQTAPKRGGIIVGEVWKPAATTVTRTENLKPQSAFCFTLHV
jgi:hypothetical protein